MTIAGKWHRKFTDQEKITNEQTRLNKRKFFAPTKKEIGSAAKALAYCRMRKLSDRATHRCVQLVTGVISDYDWRDHRTIRKEERVPRSLEGSDTPPRYWEVDL